MRLCSLALSLSLLLSACSETGNRADNFEVANTVGNQGGDSNQADSPAETAVPQRPANGSQAAQPSGQVTLSAAPAQASGGATMTLTLSNGSSEQIGYNLCTSALETRAGRAVPTGRVCTMELRMLEPGRTADHRYQLPVNMAAGSYRFLTQVERSQSGRRSAVRSNSFEVR